MTPKPTLVVAAIIRYQDKVLIAQRKHDAKIGANLWEMPGGKVEFAEDPKDAIVREIKEELGMTITTESIFDVFSHVYGASETAIHVVVVAYVCSAPAKDFALIEAQNATWITAQELKNYEFVPGDQEVLTHFFEHMIVNVTPKPLTK